MAKKRKKLPSIKYLMLSYTTAFVLSIIAIFTVAVIVAILIMLGREKEGYVVEMIILGGFFILLTVALIVLNIRIYNLCYKNLFNVSRSLINDISLNKQVFERFPEQRVKEFEELNEALGVTERHLRRSIVYSRSLDYTSLNLQVSNEKLGTIEYVSFVQNIPEIIMLSQAYRNAFVHITYGDKLSSLVGQSSLEIIKNIRRIFSYENVIVADDIDETGYIIYIPQIDSMNRLKEEIELFLKNSSMVKNTPNGKTLVIAKSSVVIYPFSDVDDIISDLRYANRQGKNMNIYLPGRLNKDENRSIMHGSYSLNRSNQLVANLAAIRIHDSSSSNVKNSIRKQLKAFAAFINADYAGVVIRNDKINRFINYIAISNKGDVFKQEDEFVDVELIDSTLKVCDEDGTYYFSTRAHLNAELGSFLDKRSVTSGFFYVITDDNGPLGFVYFTNSQKDMSLDSYLRESAFSISSQIGSIIRETSHTTRLNAAVERSEILMKLENYMMYKIDKNTYEILDASETFIDQFGKLKKKTCYKAIYGYDKPCDGCPILTKKKMIKPHKNIHYETSAVFNTSKETVARMLMQRVEKSEIPHNRFDRDFLINSYYALTEDLYNTYLIQGRGYVLVLSIENYKKLVKEYGSEGYTTYIRKLVETLNDKLEKECRFYVYDNAKIAMLIPDSGRTEIIDVCEKIYAVTKAPFIELEENDFIPIDMNYVAVKYPQEFPTHIDLLRHTEQVLSSYEHKKHIDEIYFEGTKYFRSASRAAFIDEVIDKSFKDKTFKVNLQPMVNSATKHITGAEILIRLSDDYRNQALSAYEVIKVAAQRKKIGIISNALIEYIGNLYQKHGISLFKSHNFTRLSLNTDYSYFADESFIKNISNLVQKYSLPDEFLSFEINEQELGDHFDAFKPIVSKLKSIGIHIAVDQYTGEFVSLDKVKYLGIPEIKIPRTIVRDIDVNKNNLNQLTELIKTATDLGLNSSIVGIENKDQYAIAKDLTKSSLMQGYYFYEPLELAQLIEAIRIN